MPTHRKIRQKNDFKTRNFFLTFIFLPSLKFKYICSVQIKFFFGLIIYIANISNVSMSHTKKKRSETVNE